MANKKLNSIKFPGLNDTYTIPDAQVNSDWNASTGVSSILNKPTIPAAQVNANWTATTGVASILNKPTIPAAQVNSDWNATSGVSSILNKPAVPSNLADLSDRLAYQTNNAAGYPLFQSATGTVFPKMSQHLQFTQRPGSTDTLTIGLNGNATSGAAKGVLALSNGASYGTTSIVTGGSTFANVTLTLPATTGTLALQSQIPSVPTALSSFTNDAGYLTLATLPIYDGSVS